jgi:hypothetical protein
MPIIIQYIQISPELCFDLQLLATRVPRNTKRAMLLDRPAASRDTFIKNASGERATSGLRLDKLPPNPFAHLHSHESVTFRSTSIVNDWA